MTTQPSKRLRSADSATILTVFLVFLGMAIQTMISLNGMLYSAFFQANTNYAFLIPNWVWDSYSNTNLWWLWTVPFFFFLAFPLIWGFILMQLFRLKTIMVPLYVQCGSITIDVLMVFDSVFRGNYGIISVIPAEQFWGLVSGGIWSVVGYGLGLGVLYTLLMKALKLAIGVLNRVTLPQQQLRDFTKHYQRLYRFMARKSFKNFSRYLARVLFYGYLVSGLVIGGLLVFFYGLRAQIIELPLFVTLWVAEVPIAVLLRYALGEGRQKDRPKVGFSEEEVVETVGPNTNHMLLITNQGEHGAELCEALLKLETKPEDVIDLPNAVITTQNYRAIEIDNLYWQDEGAEVSIKADDNATLEVVRLVKNKDEPPRLEIPSGKGWDRPLIGLKLHDYTGSIAIVSMNCRHVKLEFDILHDQKVDTVKLDY